METSFEEHGSGPPLILIHGLGANARIWDLVVGPLSERFRVIAYDLQGRSEVELLAFDLRELLDDLELDEVTLVGHSLGGAVAFAFAAAHPERVRRLIAVAAPSYVPPEQRTMLAERGELALREGMGAIAEVHAERGLPPAFDPELTAHYKAIFLAGTPERYAALCNVLEHLDLRAAVAAIESPTLLVAAKHDQVVPAAAVRETHTALPGSELVELDCSHIVPLEEPEALVELVLRSGTPAEPQAGRALRG